jgi:hypothetical protein
MTGCDTRGQTSALIDEHTHKRKHTRKHVHTHNIYCPTCSSTMANLCGDLHTSPATNTNRHLASTPKNPPHSSHPSQRGNKNRPVCHHCTQPKGRTASGRCASRSSPIRQQQHTQVSTATDATSKTGNGVNQTKKRLA